MMLVEFDEIRPYIFPFVDGFLLMHNNGTFIMENEGLDVGARISDNIYRLPIDQEDLDQERYMLVRGAEMQMNPRNEEYRYVLNTTRGEVPTDPSTIIIAAGAILTLYEYDDDFLASRDTEINVSRLGNLGHLEEALLKFKMYNFEMDPLYMSMMNASLHYVDVMHVSIKRYTQAIDYGLFNSPAAVDELMANIELYFDSEPYVLYKSFEAYVFLYVLDRQELYTSTLIMMSYASETYGMDTDLSHAWISLWSRFINVNLMGDPRLVSERQIPSLAELGELLAPYTYQEVSV